MKEQDAKLFWTDTWGTAGGAKWEGVGALQSEQGEAHKTLKGAMRAVLKGLFPRQHQNAT